jgi:hypothetical protein
VTYRKSIILPSPKPEGGETVPIEEEDLDQLVEPPWRRVLASMEKGKFYSLNEMSEKIIGKQIFDAHVIEQYIPAPYQGKRFVPNEEVFSAVMLFVIDLAYVNSFLNSQIALENLRPGKKNGATYFAKRNE